MGMIVATKAIKFKIMSKNLICHFFGHKFITTRKITRQIKEYNCERCSLELTDDENGNLTLLTPELREANETLINFRIKKVS